MARVDMKLPSVTKKLSALPDTPGVYLFYNARRELIYVGKAVSLCRRVRSYFALAGGALTNFRPIESLAHEIADVRYRETDSVLEAIILEANLIKKFQPRYNVLGKDDKSWNYLVITKDQFPKVLAIRQHEYQQGKQKEFAYVFGPYPGLNTKAALALLRKIFRLATCQPSLLQRPCFYYQLGQCRGVCTGEITPRQYREQMVRPLVLFLQGKKQRVLKEWARNMKRAAREERFEDAAQWRNQLTQLQRIQEVALLNKSFFERDQVIKNGEHIRIEGYDISNLGAKEKVGSMVVFDDAGPVKSGYRKFIIKTISGVSDVDSLAEVLQRRLKHPEWPLPDVVLIDGGVPQLNTARRVLAAHRLLIPMVGIAKGPQRKRNDFLVNTAMREQTRQVQRWTEAHQTLLIRVRDEAHRFAVQFHRARRGRALINRP